MRRPVTSAAFLAVVLSASVDAQPPTSHLKVSVARADGVSTEPAAEAVVATVSIDDLSHADRRVHQVDVPGIASLEVSFNAVVRLEVLAPGYWSPSRIVHVPAAGREPTSVHVELLPTGTLLTTIAVAADRTIPTELTVSFRSAPGAEVTIPEAAVTCPLGAGGLRCEVPAGLLDLKLRAPSFVSHYLWGVEVPAHDHRRLPELTLRRGASVVGWIEAPADDFDFDFGRASVRLAPRRMGYGSAVVENQRHGLLTNEETVNSRGFFHVGGVPAGSYELTVQHPGFAETRLAPIEVLPNAETEVERIELSRPLVFRLELDPPRDPFHAPWRLELFQRGVVPGNADTVARGVAMEDGSWTVGDLAAGDYFVRVEDSRGSSWASRDIELPDDLPVVSVDLPFDRLEGTLTLGEEPLAASLYFGGYTAAERVVIDSDEEGRFYVFLPRRQSWSVDVVRRDLHLFAHVDGIVVRKRPGERWAKVAIELPATKVFGEAVDEMGSPLTGVHVRLHGTPSGLISLPPSDEEGRFEVLGLSAGRWHLEATYGEGEAVFSAASLPFDVEENEEAGPFRLVLRREREVSGIVIGPDGRGVPGAQVVVLLEQVGRLLTDETRYVFTDVEGAFDLRVPADARGLRLTILPPGFAVEQVQLDALDGQPVVIPVNAISGTLTLRYPEDTGRSPIELRRDTSLFHDHLAPLVYFLETWAEMHGLRGGETGGITIPNLEPGSYTACFGIRALVYRSGQLPAGVEDRCVSGVLGPYGELVLDVPVPPAHEVEDREAAGR